MISARKAGWTPVKIGDLESRFVGTFYVYLVTTPNPTETTQRNHPSRRRMFFWWTYHKSAHGTAINRLTFRSYPLALETQLYTQCLYLLLRLA